MDDLDLIAPALKAAHRALAALDEGEVPAAVRRVATFSASSLPPPLASSLAAELESNQWLRGRIVEWWGEQGESELDPIATLFLARPDGWIRSLELMGTEQRLRQREVDLDRTLGEIEAMGRKIEKLEAKLAAEVAKGQASRSAVKEAAKAERAKVAERISRLRADLVTAKVDHADLERRLAERPNPVGSPQAHSARTKKMGAAPSAAETGFGTGDPIRLSRTLDQIAESAAKAVAAQRVASGQFEELRMPHGVRPDMAEAIRVLLSWRHAISLDVDGYNLLHELGWERTLAGRLKLENKIRQFQSAARAPMRAVVYWDSVELGENRRTGSLEIRYVPNADDAIASAASPGRVLVSNDRQLRMRFEKAGGLALWSSALGDWWSGG